MLNFEESLERKLERQIDGHTPFKLFLTSLSVKKCNQDIHGQTTHT